MKVLKTYDLSPDGVAIEVNWDRMVIGASIFVPCIDTEEAVKQVLSVAKQRQWTIEHRLRIEDAKLGVRFWRTM